MNLTSSPVCLIAPSLLDVDSLTLAVTDKSSELFKTVLPWLIVLLGVIIVGGAIIYVARRYVNAASGEASAGFTLHDLREMHRAGEISDEEFARAKSQMIGRTAARNAAHASGPPETGDPPSGNPADHAQ